MQKTDAMPLWVYLAFSSISTRKGAWMLIGASVVFTLYCIPWPQLFTNHDWVKNVFLIDGWSWSAVMVLTTCWYWISLKWIDNNSGWADSVQK